MERNLLGNILINATLIVFMTGVIMYFTPFDKTVASMHTFFALIFFVMVILHLVNNRIPAFNYLSGRRHQRLLMKFQGPIVSVACALLTIGLYLEIPFLKSIYEWGNVYRSHQLGKSESQFDFEIIELDKEGTNKISLEFKKGSAFQYPLFAVWLEDLRDQYKESIYVSRVITSSTFDYGMKTDGGWESAIVRRPESLPYWSHKRGIKAADGLYVPLGPTPDLDGISGATPTNNFIINTAANLDQSKSYNILLEVNQSYDWNEFYSQERFPNDSIYSGSGKVGQPSLVYCTKVKSNELTQKSHHILKLIGHGHHSGKDGKLDKDLSKITTAKEIAERIVLTVSN